MMLLIQSDIHYHRGTENRIAERPEVLAKSSGFFKGFNCGDQSEYNILQFVNDTILLGNAIGRNVWVLKAIFRDYGLVLGLKVNFGKIKIYSLNTVDSFLVAEEDFLSYCSDKIPFKFLGVMVGSYRRSVSSWKCVIDYLKAKLSRWKVKQLAMQIQCIQQEVLHQGILKDVVDQGILKDVVDSFGWIGDDSEYLYAEKPYEIWETCKEENSELGPRRVPLENDVVGSSKLNNQKRWCCYIPDVLLFYARGLHKGNKNLFRAFPRLLALWFNFGSKYLRSGS
ncbi:hypothetical protein KIW84_021236 [Lathyrus oleraceus]|uniref:Uncharacterized protein n=1 Tax=Pisum sativum TaxID=3888 RepID=A0A9D4Y9K2_PEA|nr:hypothetical protein KIW84_021236 [Pisum sativum]